MKKSNGSLDFSTSDDNGVIIFTSSDYIETRVELTDVSTYNVVLLPGEYRVESTYYSNESSNHVDETSVRYQLQQTVNISSDQIYDVVFPVTTLNGKVTDASGNTLENMSVSNHNNLMELNTGHYSSSSFNLFTDTQGEFNVDVMTPVGDWDFSVEYNTDSDGNDWMYNSDTRVTPPENSEYFEKGISNINPNNTLNIVLDRLEDSGVAVTGTMKKSNGSLDFSTSDDNGVIIFTFLRLY